MIVTETAKVWKTSNGRRYLTKRAAFLSEAIYRLKRKPRHEPDGNSFWEFHSAEQLKHFTHIAQRYYRRFAGRVV